MVASLERIAEEGQRHHAEGDKEHADLDDRLEIHQRPPPL
jgi:hypothetical protein